jgi:hypothetical protein
MLKLFLRRAAPPARAPAFGLAASCACLWLAAVPAADAADAVAPGQATATAFEHYQGWRDDPLQDWRKANERVGEIGGWRTYLSESQPPADSPDQNGHDHHVH